MQTLFWVLATVGPDSQNFHFLPNPVSLILEKKTCTPFKMENCKFKKRQREKQSEHEINGRGTYYYVYIITPLVVADALGVPLVQHLVYPYDESPPLDDIMSYLIGTSIQWSSDPRITSHELTEIHYHFFRISCHSIWPISHLHTIPLERYAFLYALVMDASVSFPYLFIRFLIEVHRSSSTAHGLFFSVFIHRILLHLGLDEFSVPEPILIIALIVATFLRQKAAQIRASFKRPRVDSSFSSAPPPPPYTSGDLAVDAYVDLTAATAPPPLALDVSSIHHDLDTAMTI